MLHLKIKRDLHEFSQSQPNFYDFLLLEHYLDQSVKLRLDSAEKESNLKEAHEISTIITKIIGILSHKFEGNFIPEYDFIEVRRNLAKFVGLAFFKLGRECLRIVGPYGSINKPCCDFHRAEGLIEAHGLLPKLLKPFGIELDRIDASSDTIFTSLLAVYADFNTQIIVSELVLAARQSSSGLSRCLETLFERFYGPIMEMSYLKGKLQSRAVQIRAILEQTPFSELESTLQAKYPRDLFESNLKNILRNIYASLPPTMLSELINTKKEDDKTTMAGTVPVALEEVIERPKKVKREQDNHQKEEAAPKPELKRADKLGESEFKDVVIPGRFFRGILEPVDERFAAIIEGEDVNVRRYLASRQKQSMAPSTQKSKQANSKSSTKPSSKNALLERHDSAERISWETQEFAASEKEERSIPQARPEVGVRIVNEPSFGRPCVYRSTARGRRRFSETETANLIEGIQKFGRDWKRILESYRFNDRSNVDLKDKARNLEKLGLI